MIAFSRDFTTICCAAFDSFLELSYLPFCLAFFASSASISALILSRVAADPDQAEVHIRPNKLVEYKSVATVLASAQRLGVTKLGMIGNEQFVK